jgi:ParB family transcriptional regulator, chromosome partitioning protein
MTARRTALGRGLGALIPSPPPAVAAETARSGETAREIPVAFIDPNPDQPRRRFEAAQLESLAGSIARHGVLQPVVVRPNGDRYELVVGERRWRAAQAAGLDSIPAVVADVDGGERLELALVENVQRHDLNAIELAHAYQALADRGLTQDEIGRRVGLDRSSVANHLRLLELPRDVQEDVEGGRLSAGHAKALLQVSSPERRRHLRDRIVEGGLSVREAESLAREWGGPMAKRAARSPAAAPAPELEPLLDALRRRLQTRVRVRGDARRGRLEIEYFGREDLERLSGLLLGGGA